MTTVDVGNVKASSEQTPLSPARTRPSAPRRDVLSGSPRTPLLGRSISGAFGSPGAYSREPEEVVIYELSPRHFSAGFSGESRPRCISRFGYGVHEGRRVGDFHGNARFSATLVNLQDETRYTQYELYRMRLQDVNLSLVKDRFERVVRSIHTDYLQLDQKPRKAALVVSSLMPTKILDIALDVLFNHYSQPPSITLWTNSVMACVSAGLRSGLVIDIGWEETTATIVGEYRVVFERRSIRAGRLLSDKLVSKLAGSSDTPKHSTLPDFACLEEISARCTWCKARSAGTTSETTTITVPITQQVNVDIDFDELSNVVEETYFSTGEASPPQFFDDNEQPLHQLAHEALLAVSADLRGICASRIILVGSHSRIPGLKRRLLQEIQAMLDNRGWLQINYGRNERPTSRTPSQRPAKSIDQSVANGEKDHTSGTSPIKNASTRAFGKNYEKVYPILRTVDGLEVAKKDIEETSSGAKPNVRPDWRPLDTTDFRLDMIKWLKLHDAYADHTVTPVKESNASSTKDPATQKIERDMQRKAVQPFSGKIMGVDALGAWAGTSMVAGLRVQGTHEIEREDFLKHGYRESMTNMV